MTDTRRHAKRCRNLAVFVLAAAAAFAARPLSAQVDRSDELCAQQRLFGDAFAQACYWRSLLVDEKGVIDADLRRKAWDRIQEMRASDRQPLGGGIGGAGSWTALGPGNSGGRIRAVVRHPSIANDIWIGSVGGGVFLTTDGGSSWTTSNDFLANLAVAALVLDPTDATSSTLYAGTGEGFFNIDAIKGAGIYKTTNGLAGSTASWAQLGGTNTSDFSYCNRLALSSNGNALISATRTGLWLNPNVKSATTWTRVLTPSSGWAGSAAADVKFNPADNTKAVAGGYGQAWYVSAGDARTTGAAWTLATFSPALSASSPYGRVELAYAPSTAAGANVVVYAAVDDASTAGHGVIYQSTNGGQSFTMVHNTTNFFGGQGWYDNVIFVNPNDATNVVVGGNLLATSTNGGVSFATKGYGGGGIHPDNHAIIPDPGFNNTTNKIGFIGNDGGIFKVTDITAAAGPTGTSLNANLPITQFYGGAAHHTTGRFAGGTQDNGTPGYDPGRPSPTNSWHDWTGGDGGYVAADQSDAAGNTWYGEYVYLRIERTTNFSSSTVITGGGSGCGALSDANTSAAFIAPFIIDPNSSTTLLGGGTSVWKTTNATSTPVCWTSIKPSIGSNVSALAVAPGNSQIIWVGYTNGTVSRSTDGGTSWATMGSGTLPARQVTRFAFDPTDGTHANVYVSFGGYAAGNLWRTTTGMAAAPTFTNISASLPSVPIFSVTVSPTNGNNLYAGTDLGIFDTQNALSGSPSWSANDGPANVSVRELFWKGTGDRAKLAAATHGRSIWVTTIPPATLQYYTLIPCRVLDTRNAVAPLGGPSLSGGQARSFPFAGACGIPSDAVAVSGNVTAVAAAAPGDFRLWAADQTTPSTSVVNFAAGQVRANNAVVSLSADATQSVMIRNDAPGAAHAVFDVNGYFK